MTEPRVRFTIRGLMIAIVAVAALFALPSGWREFAILMTVPLMALLAARSLSRHGQRRLAGFCFWIPAVLANGVFLIVCSFPIGVLQFVLCLAWAFLLLPILAGFGGVWAVLTTREFANTRRSPWTVWVPVVSMTALPLLTAVTLWPFQIAFLTSQPSLEALADRVAAGQTVVYPVWAGQFRIAGSVIDSASGNIGLMTDPNPNGPSAFIRSRGRSAPYDCFRPIRGDWCHLSLGGGWCYHEED